MTQTHSSQAGAGTVVPLDDRLAMHRLMLEIRFFEEAWTRLFFAGKTGPGHSSIGMEAIAAAFGVQAREGDTTYATYRGHAHTLARGVPMKGTMAELLGRSTGINGGKGGSMHLTSVEHGMMGSYAIVGAHLPVAAGTALAAKYRGEDKVTVCFFGDGATNIGAFHEALNLAALWELPVVYVCENNHYMEYTPISEVTAVPRPAADRAAAYGLEPIVVDGNDADAMYVAAANAIDRARRGGGPSLIEALTYRHLGHASSDPGKYRPAEEVASWMKRDPISIYRERLLGTGVDEATLEAMERESRSKAEEAASYAVAAPLPDVSTLDTNVWADGGSQWRK
ncbi:thiamine pyrophosphate-dependent dehydrogenase E1 component subunit alpha [Prauserella endophytica]|uniref:Thiamine pyrophosphate-dependent dehydrogenase E1 component subunit alpha n=1 Tax=Prauserella endophytica TaxID=1592324 RepID=A0ABY2S5G0_9PSEU|nr:thiamine pyrophosphate-dependent dehydrogenase E1 component subunit alpha [Prauserella endophytica]PXY33380.1 pyruvate dehydrogenase (acetyl-transferring) E1 component subunit alpha [Prauserella coralliicola]TKG70953.1 thiamine pyrophosphate-dependent dehydrogenase E1 component subunit alpha [Prauserella endophytica]